MKGLMNDEKNNYRKRIQALTAGRISVLPALKN